MGDSDNLRVKFKESGGGWGNPLMGRVFDSDKDTTEEDRLKLRQLVDRCDMSKPSPPPGGAPPDVAQFELEIDLGTRKMAITNDMVRADDNLRELVSFVRQRGRKALLDEPANPAPAKPAVVFFDLGDTLVRTSPASWIEGAREALAALSKAGVRLGVLSNTGNLKRETLASLLPPDFDFKVFEQDLILLSGEVGVSKPDPAIFKLAIERSGLQAEETLYASENTEERQAAEEAGMQSLSIVDTPGDFQRLLARF